MKKAMILASLAAMAISGNALALQTNAGARTPLVSGLPAGSILFSPFVTNVAAPGELSPLGACRYSGLWFAGAAGIGPAQTCVFEEPKQPLHTTCIANRTTDFFTSPVLAGDDVSICSGYDAAGNPLGAVIIASEFPFGLFGLVIFDEPGFPEPFQL